MPPSRTAAKIERATQELLDSIGVRTTPVPVERIASVRSLSVVFDDLGDDVSGLLYRGKGTAVIIINRDHAHHRQRFSIAHEIGHAELHDSDTYLDGNPTLRFRDGRSATGTDAEEREANRFAASLLMPALWVRERFIRMVNSPNPPNEDSMVVKLAEEFDVSDQAMRFRLVNLNLIDPT